MTSDEIQLWTQAERLELADFLDDLADHEWGVSSLCGDWTVHEVLAHVTLSNRVTLGQTLLGVLRARGDWNRMTADLARERAARFTPAELIAQLREPDRSIRWPTSSFTARTSHDRSDACGKYRRNPVSPHSITSSGVASTVRADACAASG